MAWDMLQNILREGPPELPAFGLSGTWPGDSSSLSLLVLVILLGRNGSQL